MFTFKKIFHYFLIFALFIIPIFFSGGNLAIPKAKAATTSGTYPPADFGVDWSSATAGGQPKIDFYWAPPANISQYPKDTAALTWDLNITDTSTNPQNHLDNWWDKYSKLNDEYVGSGVIWGHSYSAELDLRENGTTNIGSAFLTFTLPATGTGGQGNAGTQCSVNNLTYKTDLWGSGATNTTEVLFSWTQPTANANCSATDLKDINAVRITNPNGTVLTPSAGIYGNFTDKNPVAGTYIFTSVAIGPVDKGSATIAVTLQGGGTSIGTPGTGSNGTGTTGGTPGTGGTGGSICTCKLSSYSTILSVFMDPVCNIMCVFINAIVYIIDNTIGNWLTTAIQARAWPEPLAMKYQ